MQGGTAKKRKESVGNMKGRNEQERERMNGNFERKIAKKGMVVNRKLSRS